MALTTKIWLVTGASAGFGHAVTENALQQGDNVVAIVSGPEELSDLLSKYPSQLLVLSSDFRDPDQIHAAFENALARFGRIDIVFNNAGNCIVGEAEGVNEEHGRELFESLFWGAVNVTREAVRVFRDRNSPPGGHLLQKSSWTTLKPMAGVAHYAAAKTALECFTRGMAVELDPNWNIKITIVQPTFSREKPSWSIRVDPIHPAYSDPDLPSRRTRNLFSAGQVMREDDRDLKKCAQAMHRLAYMDDPPLELPLHRAAIGAARAKGEELIQTAEEYASWSDNIYFDKD